MDPHRRPEARSRRPHVVTEAATGAYAVHRGIAALAGARRVIARARDTGGTARPRRRRGDAGARRGGRGGRPNRGAWRSLGRASSPRATSSPTPAICARSPGMIELLPRRAVIGSDVRGLGVPRPRPRSRRLPASSTSASPPSTSATRTSASSPSSARSVRLLAGAGHHPARQPRRPALRQSLRAVHHGRPHRGRVPRRAVRKHPRRSVRHLGRRRRGPRPHAKPAARRSGASGTSRASPAGRASPVLGRHRSRGGGSRRPRASTAATAPARGHMGILLNALGHEPIVRLQTGGLKAAEVVLRGGNPSWESVAELL